MPKTISSPVERWPGTVVLYEPMTLVHEAAWEKAMTLYDREAGMAANALALLPGVFACVQEWHLANFPDRPTVDNFPTRPRLDRSKLLAWLINEISDLYREEELVPNG